MSTALDGFRVDIAFGSEPGDTSQGWTSVSDRVQLPSGISITRGRQDEQAVTSPGACTFTLDNHDGAFTPKNTGSPYYPGVCRGKQARVTWRDPATLGARNLVAAEDAAFEGGTVGSWSGAYIFMEAASALASSGTHPASGSKSLRVTWPTTAAGDCSAQLTARLVVGRTYTARCKVYNLTGQPDIQFASLFQSGTATTSTKNAQVTLTVTWVCSAVDNIFLVKAGGATTAGQQIWVDEFMIDEGSTLGAFTTTAPAEVTRWTGYVDEYATTWPTGTTTWATSTVRCVDALKRLGQGDTMRSIVEAEILFDGPTGYWPLGDKAGSSSGSNVSADSRSGGSTSTQVGSGGTVTFGDGTGPGTDGLTAPVFTPVDVSNGKTLAVTTASEPFNDGYLFTSDVSLACFVASTSTSRQVLRLSDSWGQTLEVGINGTGKAYVTAFSPFGPTTATAASASGINDGATRHVAVTATSASSGSVTKLYVNGVNVASLTTGAVFDYLPGFTTLTVGGAAGTLLAGTVSHVAVFDTALTAARLLEQYTSGATGFAGETSGDRIARYARLAGITSTALDAGSSTGIDHIDSTGQVPLSLMQQVTAAESGVLFVGVDGALTFHGRARRYTATAAASFSVASEEVADFGVVDSDQYATNDVTVTTPSAGSSRVVSGAYVTKYGRYSKALSLPLTTSAAARNAAEWEVSRGKDPAPRTTGVTFDLLTQPARLADLLLIDVSTMVTLTGLPDAAVESSTDVFIEGYTENISATGWTLACNTSPANVSRVWLLGIAGSSELGITTRLAY